MKIQFCGAAKTVTGSCHLITTEQKRILIDCGMKQGSDEKIEPGNSGFVFDPASIDYVVLTHAHIDHSGLLPLLTKKGFTGPIYATMATSRLSSIMLPDSAHIQEQDAEYINRKRMRASKPPIEPLYTVDDAKKTLAQFVPVDYNETFSLFDGVRVRLKDAGHMLGSAVVELFAAEGGKETKLVFSGDIGRVDRPIIRDPECIDSADYLIMESTYGDRNHEVNTFAQREAQLENVLRAAMRRGGNIIFPSFAVGRTQEMLYYFKKLILSGSLPELAKIPIYLDSPLGIEATKIFEEYGRDYYDQETLEMIKDGSPFELENIRIARTADESKLINTMKESAIIISSSGMCDAGRIRHHLKHNLYRADATVVFSGYQAEGTLGRILLDGAQKVKLFGEEVRVNANIEQLEGFSGHAGKSELLEWAEHIKKPIDTVFLVHGSVQAVDSLSKAMSSVGYNVEVPEMFEEFELETGRAAAREKIHVPEKDTARTNIRIQAILAQTERIAALLESIKDASVTDGELKLRLMEEDIAQFNDRWEKLLK